jgi:2'-5' RNA ligase
MPELGAVLGEAAAGVSPFELRLAGLGAFPSPTRARVIWAGARQGGEALGVVARRLEEALAGLGFPPETRAFSPHVTLGRVREPRRDPGLAAALTAGAERELGRLTVDRIRLMRSDLSPRGSRYTEVTAARLAG